VRHRCFWALLAALTATLSFAHAEFKPRTFDWPQWQGFDRTAMSKETGLLRSWQGSDGPPLAWKVKGLGGGYSTPSIAAGRIFGMSYRGQDEMVWALDETNGKELWATKIADAAKVSYGEGSRCTPTVDGEVLYALGVNGDLVCLEVATGKQRWHQNVMAAEFGGKRPNWGYSESPLVDGDKLIVTPGGNKATLVALDRKTGSVIWKSAISNSGSAAYSSVVAAMVHGRREYVQFLSGAVVGVDAETGKYLWRYTHPAPGINISTPIVHDNQVFAAAGYGRGGGLAKLVQKDNEITAEEVYFTAEHMKNHHGGMILKDGYLYGSNDPGLLTCLEFATGKLMWEERKAGKGSITYADGHLYYRDEKGPIVLVEANPQQYVEKGRFKQPERSRNAAWPHPVIANSKLYIRDQDWLLCYDVKQH
jgi:outer membrane protein assembly factor BamB